MDKNYIEVDGTVLVNLRDDTLFSASQIAEGVTGHLRTGEKVTGTGTGESNVLRGKILAVTGDSICQGAGYDGGYAGIIGEEQDMTVQNIAQGGGQIIPVSGKFCISESISSLRSDADYILLEGGGNDAGNAVTLGTLTSGYNDTLDTTTFAGAFENMLKSALNRFPDKKIGYVMIHKCMPGFTSLSGDNAYYNIAKSACEKWGIPFLDLSILVPPLADVSALAQAYTQDGYGVHPNEQGYRLFYVPQITAFMKSMITDYSLISKTITDNGTYLASDDNADGYSSVTVNVSSGGGTTMTVTGTVEGNGTNILQIPCDFEPDLIYINGDLSANVANRGIVALTILKNMAIYLGNDTSTSTSVINFDATLNITGYNESDTSSVHATYSNNVLNIDTVVNSGSYKWPSGITYTYKLIKFGQSAPSATTHTIHFAFTDNTSTDITAYYDSTFISSAITATIPSMYDNKTVTSASLDGVAWYELANIPLNTELIDFSKCTANTSIDYSGEEIEQEWYYASDFTLVNPSMTFTYKTGTWTNIGLYDSNKTFVRIINVSSSGTVDQNDSNLSTGTLNGTNLPSNVAYVKLSSTGANSNYMSLIRTA